MFMPVTQFVLYPSRHEHDTWSVGQNFRVDQISLLHRAARGEAWSFFGCLRSNNPCKTSSNIVWPFSISTLHLI